MKRNTSRQLVLFFSCLFSFYQANSQSWNRTGNNIISTDYIGVNNGRDLIFKTSHSGGITVDERMRITHDGRFGFGIAAPSGLWSPALTFQLLSSRPEFRMSNTDSTSLSLFSTSANNYIHSSRALTILIDTLPGNSFIIAKRNSTTNYNEADHTSLLKLNQDGMLFVRGLKVQTDSFPDFVFEPCYLLMPLNDLKEYIKKEQHLPGIPSAAEVSSNGLDVAFNQTLLLKKIEELTLYVISLKEEIDQLKTKAAHEQK